MEQGNIINASFPNNNNPSEIARQAMDIEIKLDDLDIKADLNTATRMPYGEVTGLGAAFLPLLDSLAPAANAAESIVQITDRNGLPLPVSALYKFHDGTGHLASFRDQANQLAQARLNPLSPQDAASAISSIPYDPMTMAIAAMLLEINHKLDRIMETQQAMFEYIKNKDRAKLRGNLETLGDIIKNYKFNYGSEEYKHSKQLLVQTIQKEARESIIQHRAEIEGHLNKREGIQMDKDVRSRIDAVRSELEEYRLANYLFAFSSFLEIMLRENFDPDYLASTKRSIAEHSIKYRELYAKAYNQLESNASSSVRAKLLRGASSAAGFLGEKVEQTKLGDATPIDEALISAGGRLDDFSKDIELGMMTALVDASVSDVQPFMDNIDSVNRLYNKPVVLLAGEDEAYVLPLDVDEQVA